jgi:hypothetical protein
MLNAEEQSAWADYQAHKANGDHHAAADAAQQAFAARDRRDAFTRHCYQQTAQPQPRPVSDEQRAARRPEEMTAQDHADMWNQSRYANLGGRFTAQDVHNRFAGLSEYKRTRGSETK